MPIVHMPIEAWAWYCYRENLAVLLTNRDNWTHEDTKIKSDLSEGWVCIGKIENKTGRHEIRGKEYFNKSPLVMDGYMCGPRIRETRPKSQIVLVYMD
jgi:predicted DNA-binding ArsR family transcriptional regulator